MEIIFIMCIIFLVVFFIMAALRAYKRNTNNGASFYYNSLI